jgi:hypothetical protein
LHDRAVAAQVLWAPDAVGGWIWTGCSRRYRRRRASTGARSKRGLQGDPTAAGRARVAVRKLLGDAIKLLPAKGGGHLIAHLESHRAALLAGTVGSVGSGGSIRSITFVRYLN